METERPHLAGTRRRAAVVTAALTLAAGIAASVPAHAEDAPCPTLRKLNIGVSVVPPNVVHTTPHVAKALGYFEKRCIDANIMYFEGGQSQTMASAISQGLAIGNVNDGMVAQGMKAKQIWGFAPLLPQAYTVAAEVKTPADLKGKRLSAAGGGVGGFNWRMARAILEKAGIPLDDVIFVSQGLAGRLPGLVAGQLDGVALHPEDVYLAEKQKPGLHVLVVLSEMMPDHVFNAYGGSVDMIAENRELLIDAAAAMIEANRTIYADKDKVIPIMVEATGKPRDAVEFAYDYLTKNCVWAVNTGFDKARTAWTAQYTVDSGDVPPEKKTTYDQLVDQAIADAAVAKAGGPTTAGACKL